MAIQSIDLGPVVGPQGQKGDTPTAEEIKAALPAATEVEPGNTDIVTSDLLWHALHPSPTAMTILEDTAITPAVNSSTIVRAFGADSPSVLTVTLPTSAENGDSVSVLLVVADEAASSFSPYPRVTMVVSAPDYVAFGDPPLADDPWAILLTARFAAGTWLVEIRGFAEPDGWEEANSTRKVVFSNTGHPSLSPAESYQMIEQDGTALDGPTGFATLLGSAQLVGWTDELTGSTVKWTPTQEVDKADLARVTTLRPLYAKASETVLSMDSPYQIQQKTDYRTTYTTKSKTLSGESGVKFVWSATVTTAKLDYASINVWFYSSSSSIGGEALVVADTTVASDTGSGSIDVPGETTRIEVKFTYIHAEATGTPTTTFLCNATLEYGDVEVAP